MDQIEFADGFDRPDTLAFGLGAGQLAVVMVGALAAYSLVRSPLPPAVVDPVAVVIAVAAAGLGWLRVAGRPALDWAVFAGLFWMRPRRGTTRWELATESRADGISPPARAIGHRVLELFGKRRTAPSTPPGNRRKVDPDAAPPGRDPIDGRTSGPGGAAFSPSRADPSSAILRPTTRASGARRVTFFSLRGGTGRSTLATELTCLLASSRSEDHPAPRVALVDLDLRSPSVAIRLGTPERTLLDFALAPPEDRSVIDFMVTHASGARVLLGPQSAVNPEWPVTPGAAARGAARARHGRLRPRGARRLPGAQPVDHDRDLRVR